MLFPSLVASALLLGASAFVAVPEIAGDLSVSDLVVAPTTRQLKVDVKCQECPFPLIVDDSTILWDDKFDSSLGLNFTTSEKCLALNDRQIFPIVESPVHLEAVLHRLSDGLDSIPVPLGFALEILPSKRATDEESELLSFHFTVVDIAGYPVPVDTVHMQLIKTTSGDLFLVEANVDVSPDPPTSWRECRRNANCLKELIVARIRAVFAAAKARALQALSKIGFKGCPGKRPHGTGRRPPHSHQGGFKHGFKHTFSRVIRLIAIPAILGLVSGVTACVLGMIVGRVIVSLWAFFRRRGRARESSNLERGDHTERQALMIGGEDELPPQYEAEWDGDAALPAEKE